MRRIHRELQMSIEYRPAAAAGLARLDDDGKATPYFVRLLNMRSTHLAKRLTLIVEACQRVAQLSEEIRLLPQTDSKAQRGECTSVLRQLNAWLSGYKWHPKLAAYTDQGFYFHVRYGFRAASYEENKENQ